MTEVTYTEAMSGRALGAEAQETTARPQGALRLVLVNMPFASYRQPSLALGILKAVAQPLAAGVSVLDANLVFAEMISPRLYDTIATWPAQDLLGDWIFSAARASAACRIEGEYEERILAGGTVEHQAPHFGKPPVTAELRRGLQRARRLAEDLLQQCLDEITRTGPDIVGFTAMFHQLSASLALAERVKSALPGVTVVLGGASCRGEMGAELLRSFPFLDDVVVGDGEGVLRDMMRGEQQPRLRPGSGDAELGTPDSGRCQTDDTGLTTSLNLLPYPDYEDYFARLDKSSLGGTFVPRIPFETSRGCWWGEKMRCIFCGQGSRELSYRQKEPARAFAEIDHLTRKYPNCPVFFTDEVIPADAFDNFIPQLPSHLPDLDVVYLELRPNMKREQLQLLADAGMRRLEVGIESLSTPILRLIRKGTTALQGVQFLKQARELGLEVVWNLLWGLPGEDATQYAEMAEMVPLISHLQPPNTVGSFRLDRFSPIFEDPARFGIEEIRPYPAYSYVYDLPADRLARLAYFFTFHYQVPRAVASYTEVLAERIVEWKKNFPTSRLSYFDDGDKIVLSDDRSVNGGEEMTILTGVHRSVYLACDEVVTAAQLDKKLTDATPERVSAGELAEAVDDLVTEGLLLRDGRRYLSLGLRQA